MSRVTESNYDVDLESLYSWIAPPTPPAPSCPEALFSVTLKGTIDGHETLLTARGQTAEDFRRNLESLKGLLDPVIAKQCPTHGALRQGKHGWFCPHKLADGTWCKNKSK